MEMPRTPCLALLAVCLLTPLTSAALTAISSKECARSKSCFRSPDRCSGKDCTYFASWKPVDAGGQKYLEIELAGPVESSSGYIAMGFSEDDRMGNDGVVACIASPSGAITFRAAYNPGKSNQIVMAPNGFLSTSDSSDANLLGGSFQASGKVLSCRFRRLLKPSSEVVKLKDLSSPNMYYVLISRGSSTSATVLNKHFSGGHAVTRFNYDLASKSYTSGGQAKFNLVKAHAGLMMIAWLFCSAVGVVMARGFKMVWATKTLGGQKVWFQFHRGLQITCVLATIAAFVLIFVHVGGYSSITTLPGKAHPILGIIVTALAVANPILAAFRPAPTAPKRPIFNWVHFGVGMLAQIFAIVTIFIGVKLPPAGAKFAAADYPLWILITYTLSCVLMEIAIYINGRRIAKSLAGRTPILTPSVHSTLEASFSEAVEKNPEDKKSDQCIKCCSLKSACTIHKLILGIFVLVVGTLTLSLVILMALN